MKLIFVHGWSVTHTNTYGDLPKGLTNKSGEFGIDLDISHIHLGKYISFHDEVSVDDIATALNAALADVFGTEDFPAFSCITHSTGGPVVRHWVNKYYGSRKLDAMPLQHLVMLAPANHGSSLAIIGKKRVGRIKAWFSGVEPGQRVLDWLCLGSEGQWQLNSDYLGYKPAAGGFYPFVLTGQGIDRKFYDFLNDYLVEPGSDGVVRVAGGNLNTRFVSLEQKDELIPDKKGKTKYRLGPVRTQPVRVTPKTPLGVFHNFSHSGSAMGIMAVSANNKKTVDDFNLISGEILKCLQVGSEAEYGARADSLDALTRSEQAKQPVGKDTISRYAMLVIQVKDNHGDVIDGDNFDLILLGGKEYRPDKLPKGFFVDRQFNKKSNSLVYYIDADKMSAIDDDLFGLRVEVRPEAGSGFAYFYPCEFRSEGLPVERIIAPNQSTYIDITVNRYVDKNVFRFDKGSDKPSSFKGTKPSGEAVNSENSQ